MSMNRLRLLGAIGFLFASFALLFAAAQSAARSLQAREKARGLVAEALAESDRPEHQDALFLQARAADPTYDAAPCQKGTHEERFGHWTEAAASFRACIDLDPRQTYAHLRYAKNLLNASGPESALGLRTHLMSFLEETEGSIHSERDAAGRRAMRDLSSDLAELLTVDAPHSASEIYTADELVIILLRSQARGDSRYEGPRAPLHLDFHTEDVVLGAKSLAQLQEVCRALHDGNIAGSPIQIEGHADSREGRSGAERDALGRQRAEAVRGYLIHQCGIPANLLTIKSFADRIPLDVKETEAGRSANRRVELFNLRERTTVRGDQRDEGSSPEDAPL